MPKPVNMKVTIRIGGGYIFVNPGVNPDKQGYLAGYGLVAIPGGARLTERREFVGAPPKLQANQPVAERILPVGVINVLVQKESEGEYEYLPSQYVAKHWPVKMNPKDDGDKGKWSDVRSINRELEKYSQTHPEYPYAPPPIRFTGYSVFAFFNHGTFSTDKKRILVGSNLTTKETIIKPAARIDFEVPPGEELVVTVARPRQEGTDIVMHEEEWIDVKGLRVIRSVEIGIDPLNSYAKLPVAGYEGDEIPPADHLGGG
jgi:hypothetical protein